VSKNNFFAVAVKCFVCKNLGDELLEQQINIKFLVKLEKNAIGNSEQNISRYKRRHYKCQCVFPHSTFGKAVFGQSQIPMLEHPPFLPYMAPRDSFMFPESKFP
jgi:hypothetical protein